MSFCVLQSNSKLRVQEKNALPVVSLIWGPNGEDIFCGFTTGRLVRFSVKFSEKSMHHVPICPEQYGSDIVQLSVLKTSLLVSTLERTFALDTETNKLSQVSGLISEGVFISLVIYFSRHKQEL